MLYTALLQIICGWLAPQVFQVCAHNRHASSYAEARGIPPSDARLRRIQSNSHVRTAGACRLLLVLTAQPCLVDASLTAVSKDPACRCATGQKDPLGCLCCCR
jgi:hypothetical protein